MGGGGGGETTNVTNTGLGDDQYQGLADNQFGISGQISTARDDAEEAYQNIYSSFDQSQTNRNDLASAIGSKGVNYDFSNFGDGVTMTNATDALRMAVGLQDQDLSYDVNGDGVVDALDGQGMMSNIVGLDPSSQSKGLYKEFADQTNAITDQFGNVMAGQGDLNRTIGQQAIGTQSVIGGNLDTLGQTMGGRFDTVDTNTGNIQGTVDQTLVDQAKGFTDAQADRTAQFNAANSAMSTGFVDTGAALNSGFDAASTQLTGTQANVLDGQGTLQNNLDVMGNTADVYAEQSLDNQSALQSGQDTFVSSFDSYVDRYGQDSEIAQQSRSDLATAQANQTDRLREDLGSFAQAAATGQGTISSQIGSLGEGTAAGFDTLGSAVGTGFSDASMSDQQAAVNLTNRLGNVRDLISTSTGDLDANTQAQYSKLFNSFDQNGTLISNSIDENGNTLSRRFDDQGNIIETSFDAAGNQIGSVSMDVDTMLSNAESYQSTLTGQIGQVGSDIGQVGSDIGTGFQSTRDALGAGFADASASGSVDQGNLVNQLSSLDSLIQTSSGNIDQNLLSQYTRLSNSFDENGNLITNSIGDQGLTISRSFDAQGRILENSFDSTGNQVGSVSMDVAKMLSNAAAYQNSLTGQVDQLGSDIGTGFAGATGQVDQLGADLSTGQQDVITGLEATSAGFDANLQQQYTALSQAMAEQNVDINSVLANGFDANAGTLNANAKSLLELGSQVGTLDANMANSFTSVASAFDEQGNLIGSTTDELGNAVTNQLDAQGNLITTNFDAQGNQIGQTETNIQQTLGQAASMQTQMFGSLGEGQQGLMSSIDQTGSTLDSSITDQYRTLSSNLSSQGLDISSVLANGFNANTGSLDANAKSLLDLGSQVGTLDSDLSGKFNTVSAAFDAQGNLIGQTTDELGNAVTNQISDQGNLITTKFDSQGNQISQSETNIQQTLGQAASMQEQMFGSLGTGQQGIMSDLSDTGSIIDDTITNQYSSLANQLSEQGIDISTVLTNGFDANTNILNTNAKSLLDLGSQMGGVDSSVTANFAAVSAAFDEQGNLIGSTIDELGNSVENQIDQQGNLITSKFDSTGQLIDQSQTNIQTTLSQASEAQMQLQNYLADTTSSTLSDLGSSMDQGFASINDSQQDAYSQIDQGFNQQSNTLDTQTKNIAAVAANQTDIDQKSRNEFKQLSNAFDDQGQLITNTVNENGTTISRAIDQNGNLLLRSFDMQGNRLGDQVLNINRSLYNLSQLDTYQGANISMGNLSPAMSQGAPTDGFASPYAVTG